MAFKAVVKPTHNSIVRPALPRQAISRTNKGKQWREQNVDAIQMLGSVSVLNGRTSRQRKQINYNLVNSIFDPDDFKYVTDPYNVGAELGNAPAELRDFNLIANKVQLLKGEEMDTPFGFEAIGVSGEVLNAVSDARKTVIVEAAMNLVRDETKTLRGLIDENQSPALHQVARNFDKTHKDIRERNANQVIQYLLHKQNLKAKFNEGFEHALISSEEVYYVGLGAGGNPTARVVNPLNFDYDKNTDVREIENGDWAKEDRWLSPAQIIDLHGPSLSDDNIRDIEDGNIGTGYSTSQFYPGYLYQPADFKISLVNSAQTRGHVQAHHILVTHVVWKSRKRIGFVREISPNGEMVETIVDEAFKITDAQKEAGVTIEWQWINEVWQGTKIGHSLYIDIEPLSFQIRSLDSPSECKLPYVGRVYNNLNATATSLVELLKPHQYLYNIVWYRLENELAKAKGKAFVMDLAQIPRSHGIDVTEWIYYFENAGIAFINSFEEGTDIFAGEKPAFNQFKDIDRTLSNVVGQYILILNKIEEMMENIVGISPQRQSKTQASETATGVTSAINQSTAITAPYFQTHNLVIEQVLTQLIEVAKVAYSDGKKAAFVVDEIYRVTLDVDGAIFNDSDYGVFITNSIRNKIIRNKMEALAETAVQSGQARLKDLARIYRSASVAEMDQILDESIFEQQQQQLEINEQKNQALLEIEREKTLREIEKLDRTDAIEQLKADTDVAVARINALGKLGVADFNQNNIADILEVEKTNLEAARNQIERDKLASAERIKNREFAFKERDSKRKVQIAGMNKNRFDN